MERTEAEEKYYALSRMEMAAFVPSTTKTLLDAGCGEGWFGKDFMKSGAEVWGVEIHKESAQVAETILSKVLTGSIEENLSKLPDGYFDCIVFNDVLEHLLDPDFVLREIKSKLSNNGVIVTSIPNVRYWKNLRKLLFKRDWKYEDSGILDRTHFRFFTKISIERMFINAGYSILQLKGINGSKSLRFDLFNAYFLFKSGDARFLQFACVATPKNKQVS